MKKGLLIVIGAVILIVAGFLILLNVNHTNSTGTSNVITPNNVRGIIKPEIQQYCKKLDSQFNNSNCIVCRSPLNLNSAYEYLNESEVNITHSSYNGNNFTKYQYKGISLISPGGSPVYYFYKKTGNVYNVTAFILTALGGRGDRSSHSMFNFILDKNGTLLQDNLNASNSCQTQ